MRVLVLTQYFTPEVGATQTRLHTFAAGLAARGHEVEVVCERPNHPQGVVHPDYRRRPVRRQRLDGFRGAWVWVHTAPQKSARDYMTFYASYAAMATAWGSLTRRPDVIFASSPPLPVGAAAAALSRVHRCPWVLDVRDLWPEVAVALGELSNPRMLALAERLERFLYRDAAALTTVTEPFRDHIRRTPGLSGDVTLMPNGTTRLWVEAAERSVDRATVSLPKDRFIWTYAGNLGRAQGLATALQAADLVGEGFQLVLLGDGAARRALEEQAAGLTPDRVVFRRQVPPDAAADILRASDALLVSLSPAPALNTFVPSKLFDCCAVGRPVIVAAPGEAARLADEADAGLTVAPGDPQALADAVRRLRDDSLLRTRLSAAGRRFGAANLRELQIEPLEAILTAAAGQRRRVGTGSSPAVSGSGNGLPGGAAENTSQELHTVPTE